MGYILRFIAEERRWCSIGVLYQPRDIRLQIYCLLVSIEVVVEVPHGLDKSLDFLNGACNKVTCHPQCRQSKIKGNRTLTCVINRARYDCYLPSFHEFPEHKEE